MRYPLFMLYFIDVKTEIEHIIEYECELILRRCIHFESISWISLLSFFYVCMCVCVQLRAQRSMSRTCVQIYPIIVCIYLLRRIHVQHIHKYKYIHSNTHLQLAIHPCKNVRLHIFMASLPFYNSNDIVFFFSRCFYFV